MDLAAGLLLAAIAVPEQVATAGLAGLPSVTGLIAFVAASIGFAIFGSSRVLSAGADSTIAPIIAGGLAAICSAGTAEYDGLASLLALMVGAILVVAALSRAGWIADLLSIPVTAGFLAGVSIHIAVAELPAAIGVPGGRGTVIEQLAQLEAQLPHLNTYALMIGLTAFLATLLTEKLAPRWPGALLAILLGGAAVAVFHLHGAGVLTAAALPPVGVPRDMFAEVSLARVIRLAPLAVVIALVCMMQTATVARSFGDEREPLARISPNFGGVGVGCILSGLCGAFPVNASPPRTAAVVHAGGRSQFVSLAAAACVVALLLGGRAVFQLVPQAALAGILIAIAARMFRLTEMLRIARTGGSEIILVVASIVLVVALPIEVGMLCSIALSLMQSIYGLARPLCVALSRVPGTTVWWPPGSGEDGETEPGVLVFAPAAPVTFTNVVFICRRLQAAVAAAAEPVRLVVIEASGITEVDYTGASVLRTTLAALRRRGIRVVLARLSAGKARHQADRTGLLSDIGADNIFRSVEDAIARSGGPARP